jgi:spore coat protein U-like protein
MKASCSFALAACIWLGTAQANAATCSINEIQGLDFGAYAPFSGSAGTATGWVVYQCDVLSALQTVTINLSTGSSGSYAPWRTMLTGIHPLNYNLYLDPGKTQIFGDGNGSTVHWGPAILPIVPTKVFIYGHIPPSQNAWQGTYSDTVVITMLF